MLYALPDLHYAIIIDVSYPFKYVFLCACLSYLNSRFLVYWLLFAFVGSPSFVYGYLLYPNKLLDWIEWLANFQRSDYEHGAHFLNNLMIRLTDSRVNFLAWKMSKYEWHCLVRTIVPMYANKGAIDLKMICHRNVTKGRHGKVFISNFNVSKVHNSWFLTICLLCV